MPAVHLVAEVTAVERLPRQQPFDPRRALLGAGPYFRLRLPFVLFRDHRDQVIELVPVQAQQTMAIRADPDAGILVPQDEVDDQQEARDVPTQDGIYPDFRPGRQPGLRQQLGGNGNRPVIAGFQDLEDVVHCRGNGAAEAVQVFGLGTHRVFDPVDPRQKRLLDLATAGPQPAHELPATMVSSRSH